MNKVFNIAINNMTSYDKDIYKRWIAMLHRCYGKNARSCYDDCYVCEEWLIFSNFHEWMNNKNLKGMELDKDLMSPLSKIYSPETCALIPSYINKITTNTNDKGKYLAGVTFHKPTGKFRARVTHKSKRVSLGLHKTEKAAYIAYLKGKLDVIYYLIRTERKDVAIALSVYFNGLYNKLLMA